MSTNLGTEVDFALGYKLAKKVQLNGGFSKMYETSFLEVLIGGERTTNNFSTWVMFIFKPTLFVSK
jgi:hypothetical protein